MNLRQFIKNYWAALGGAVLLLWLEFQMDWVGFPYGDEAQKTVNILLLVASFISVLTSNGRAEQIVQNGLKTAAKYDRKVISEEFIRFFDTLLN